MIITLLPKALTDFNETYSDDGLCPVWVEKLLNLFISISEKSTALVR